MQLKRPLPLPSPQRNGGGGTARAQALASGKVVDGRAFGDYLKAKARGQTTRRPKPTDLKAGEVGG